jgi:hypothetical protein
MPVHTNNNQAYPAAKVRRHGRTPAALPRAQEVSAVAEFPRPWSHDSEEIEVMKKAGKWHPTVNDLEAVANTPNTINGVLRTDVIRVKTIGELVGVLEKSKDIKRPPHSVKRLNIFSHGNPGLVALSGTVAATGDVKLGDPSEDIDAAGKLIQHKSTHLDHGTISWLNELDDFNKDINGPRFRNIARNKLHPEAEIWLILCNGAGIGKSFELAREIANTFGVAVYGYETEICYHPTYDGERGIVLSRTTTSIGEKGEPGIGYYSMEKVYLDKAKTKRLGEHLTNATRISPTKVYK